MNQSHRIIQAILALVFRNCQDKVYLKACFYGCSGLYKGKLGCTLSWVILFMFCLDPLQKHKYGIVISIKTDVVTIHKKVILTNRNKIQEMPLLNMSKKQFGNHHGNHQKYVLRN